MEKLLRSKEYYGLVETGITAAPSDATPEQFKAVEESKMKYLKVKNFLFQSIDRSILETILMRNSKEILDSMKRKYQGSYKG